jgi:hypothetical protein
MSTMIKKWINIYLRNNKKKIILIRNKKIVN